MVFTDFVIAKSKVPTKENSTMLYWELEVKFGYTYLA